MIQFPILQPQQHFLPAQCAFPVAVTDGQELLISGIISTYDHQNAASPVIKPHVEVDAINPDIGIFLVTEVPGLPSFEVILPAFFQPHDIGG